MTTSELDAHSRAVISIQALLSKQPPDTPRYRVIERALDLAFNGVCPRGGDYAVELLADSDLIIAQQLTARLIDEVPPSRKSSPPDPNFQRGRVYRFLPRLRRVARQEAESDALNRRVSTSCQLFVLPINLAAPEHAF
jgi:hypothetical protein